MAGEKTQRSIQSTLLAKYLLTILSVLTVVTVIFALWQINILRKSIDDGLRQTCNTVVLNVDKEIQRMDTTSINVLYSNLAKETFAQYSGYASGDGASSNQSAYERNNNAERLVNLLFTIMGADRSVRQINLYELDSGCFGVGMYTGYINQDAPEQDWYAKAVENGGRRYIPLPEKKPMLSSQVGAREDQYYLSLVRQFHNSFNKAEGFVEILQYHDVVFATAISPESVYAPRVIVYDLQGQVVFPAEKDASAFFDYMPMQNDGLVQLRNPVSDKNEYAVFGSMPYSGFTVAVIVENSKYYEPIRQFLLSMAAVFVIVTIVCCIIAYYVTRKLSTPISEMYAYLKTMDFNGLNRLETPELNSGILEIETLRDSIDQFQKRLKISTDNIILLQRQEMQLQMLALQSQMNPHFLYNSLATVSAMAEEGMTDEIGELCSSITAILRYISSNKEPVVPLEDELANTYRYINCLKLRFGGSLICDMDIPDDMLGIPVPKLCVQLLVENAVKFTTPTPLPWRIGVRAEAGNGVWTVTVSDSGSGFSDEAAGKLSSQIREINKTRLLPSLELDGMGLLNIYIRLFLFDEESHIFRFCNRPQGGAEVTIGGRIDA